MIFRGRNFRSYSKGIVAAIGAILEILATVTPLLSPEWQSRATVVIAIATALSVYFVPNKPVEVPEGEEVVVVPEDGPPVVVVPLPAPPDDHVVEGEPPLCADCPLRDGQ